jgi:DNA-binding NtrC family response regulator
MKYESRFYQLVNQAMWDIIEKAIWKARGNKSEAARALGIDRANFSRLERKLKLRLRVPRRIA